MRQLHAAAKQVIRIQLTAVNRRRPVYHVKILNQIVKIIQLFPRIRYGRRLIRHERIVYGHGLFLCILRRLRRALLLQKLLLFWLPDFPQAGIRHRNKLTRFINIIFIGRLSCKNRLVRNLTFRLRRIFFFIRHISINRNRRKCQVKHPLHRALFFFFIKKRRRSAL